MRINYFWQPSSTLNTVQLSQCICFISCGPLRWLPSCESTCSWATPQLQQPTCFGQHIGHWRGSWWVSPTPPYVWKYLSRQGSLLSVWTISVLFQLPLLLAKLILIFTIVIFFYFVIIYIFSGQDSFHIMGKEFWVRVCSCLSPDSGNTFFSLSCSI